MNYVISIIHPQLESILLDIFKNLQLVPSMSFNGHGTAPQNILGRLGIDTPEKRIFFTFADEDKTKELISAQNKHMYINVPGNGVVVAVPIKSVGGSKTLDYISGGETKKVSEINYAGELIIAIANEGHTDSVMAAARLGGAVGGTVLHGKGTGAKGDRRFYNVSISSEKEVVLIIASKEKKKDIMQSIAKLAGPDSDAGAIVFSLPVSDVAGIELK